MTDPTTPAFDPAHLARLARLALPPDELARLAHDLERVLGYVASLQTLDLAAVPPTSHPLDLHSPLRPDLPTPPLPREVALSCAAHHDAECFTVPRVV